MDFWHFMFLFKGSVVRWQARQTGFLHRGFSRRRRASHSGPLTLAGPSPSPGGLSPGCGLWSANFEGWDLMRCQEWRWPSSSWTTTSLPTELFATKTLATRTTYRQEYRCDSVFSTSQQVNILLRMWPSARASPRRFSPDPISSRLTSTSPSRRRLRKKLKLNLL